jgi:hypothetical protein
VPSREERLAQNEVRFREINESAQPQRELRGDGRFVCECADRGCMAWLEVPTEDYAAVRQNPRRFIVTPTHEVPDVESIVERKPGYFVVEKPDEVAHIVEGGEPQ